MPHYRPLPLPPAALTSGSLTIIIMAVTAAVLSGCNGRAGVLVQESAPSNAETATAPIATSQSATPALEAQNEDYQDQIRSLKDEVDALQQRLNQRQGSGRGAYAHGPTLGSDGSSATMLDRLHELQKTVRSLREEKAQAHSELTEVKDLLGKTQEQSKRLQGQVALLRDADEQLQALQQERRECLRQIAQLREHLSTSEVERLRSERRHYDLIREVITLRSDETRRLLGLQSRLRGEASSLRPDDLARTEPQDERP